MPRSSTFFSPPSKSFPSPSILLLRAVETFLRNNNNDYVFLPRYETIYSQFTVFQCKKKKLNRRENERKIRMKELFYLEAKRERGAAKSNFDKFKSNLNDRLQFCSKTKGGGWRKKKRVKRVILSVTRRLRRAKAKSTTPFIDRSLLISCQINRNGYRSDEWLRQLSLKYSC